MLELRNICFKYIDDNPLVEAFSIFLKKGEFTCLIGKNGCGKTTLLRIIIGLLKSDSGNIFLKSRDINKYSVREKSGLISMVSQKHLTQDEVTVMDILAIGDYPYRHGGLNHEKGFSERLKRAIDSLCLQELLKRRVSTLSGGEEQRVMVGRALVQDTPVILLDEPTLHCDLSSKLTIYRVLQNLCKKEEKTILMVSHEINLSLSFCDKLLFMNKGNIGYSLVNGPSDGQLDLKKLENLLGVPLIVFENEDQRFIGIKNITKILNNGENV